MEDFQVSDALIAIAFGVFVLLVAVPVIAVVILTALDIVFRQDIGFSRLVWLVAALMIPVAGVVIYWLLRPKDFDPLLETREAAYPRHLMYVRSQNGHAPLQEPTPIGSRQGAATTAVAEADEEPQERAA